MDREQQVRRLLINALATTNPHEVKDKIIEALCTLDGMSYEEYREFEENLNRVRLATYTS